MNGGEKGDDDISGSGEGEGSSLDGKADESTAKIAGGQGKRKSRFHAWLDTGMLSGAIHFAQLSNLRRIPNSVRIGFGPVMKMGSSRRFK